MRQIWFVLLLALVVSLVVFPRESRLHQIDDVSLGDSAFSIPRWNPLALLIVPVIERAIRVLELGTTGS